MGTKRTKRNETGKGSKRFLVGIAMGKGSPLMYVHVPIVNIL